MKVAATLLGLVFAAWACMNPDVTPQEDSPETGARVTSILRRESASEAWYHLVKRLTYTKTEPVDAIVVATAIGARSAVTLDEARHAVAICHAVKGAVHTAVPNRDSPDVTVQAADGTELTEPDCTSKLQPWSITTGSDGNLWFSAPDVNEVGRVTPSGDVTMFADPTHTVERPDELTLGADGNIWFVSNDRYGRITRTGVITTFPLAQGELMFPENITSGPDGNVWFSAHDGTQIFVRTSMDGRATVIPDPNPVYVTGLTTGADGNLWFTERASDQIGQLTPAGVITMFPDPLGTVATPFGITGGPDGNVWFTNANGASIGRITPTGQIATFTDPAGTVDYPAEITAGPDGNVWFTSVRTQRIGRTTPDGQITTYPIGTLTGLRDITAGPDGNMWFTADNNLGRMTPTGAFTAFPLA
jgi:streptogramin lyase